MPLPPAPAKRAALLSLDALPTLSNRARTKASARAPIALATPVLAEMTDKIDAPTRSYDDATTDFSAPAPASAPARKSRSSKPRDPQSIKLFVLDTNVLMHDPTSLFRFEEHDLFIPMATLEEHPVGSSLSSPP